MATLRDIKTRIRSVREIQKITAAMKMVAVAKLRKAQIRQEEYEAFRVPVAELFFWLAPEVRNRDHGLLCPRREEKIWIIVLTSDRGLCGAYNHNIIKETEEFIADLPRGREIKLLISGRKGMNYFRRRDYAHLDLDLPEDIGYRSRVVSELITGAYMESRTDRVYLVADRFRLDRESGVRVNSLLPISADTGEDEKEDSSRRRIEARRKMYRYQLEPGLGCNVDYLSRLYLHSLVHRLFLDSEAAEQFTRMKAMELATGNADDLIFELTLSYNKARQETITAELIDIMGGVQA